MQIPIFKLACGSYATEQRVVTMELYCTPKVNTLQYTVHRFSNATPESQSIALLIQCVCPKSLCSRTRLLIPILLWKQTAACLHCCERRGNVCFHCCDALPVAGQVLGCGVAPTSLI
jgi:hypothetical protein